MQCLTGSKAAHLSIPHALQYVAQRLARACNENAWAFWL
jgi:hypothetical protein